jgi:GT2 family glycosyltransferase
VVSHNSTRWLRQCLVRLIDSTSPGTAVQVVDTGSSDGSTEIAREFAPRVETITVGPNLGFAGACNLGIDRTAADVVVVLNPDVVVRPTTFDALLSVVTTNPTVGIAGGKLLYPDGVTIQHAGGIMTYPLALTNHFGYGQADQGQYEERREVDYVTGALFAVRKSAVAEVGYFDEGFYPAYFEETDLCYRLRLAGHKVVYVPDAVAIHHESVTTGRDTYRYFRFFHRNRMRFVLKHYTVGQLGSDFFPAEASRLFGLGPGAEAAALREAYNDALEVLRGTADYFPQLSRIAPLRRSQLREDILRELATIADQIGAFGNPVGLNLRS